MPYRDGEARRAAYALRRDEFAAKARERRANDGGRHNELARARRAANPEHYKAALRAYYARNTEILVADQRRRYAEDPDKYREAARKAHARRMTERPEQYRAWIRARWARERGAEGFCTAADWQRVLDFYGEKCLRCGTVIDLTQDHVIPLARGGTHWPWNLQPLCRGCNSAKGARSEDDYRCDGGKAIYLKCAGRHEESPVGV